MDRFTKDRSAERSTTTERPSPVKAVISWLVETDREFRVAQSMINETHDAHDKIYAHDKI
jgi:hypothetical protein